MGKFYFFILIFAAIFTGIAQQKTNLNRITKENPEPHSYIHTAHLNTPLNKITIVGDVYAFTDYDYCTNNSMRPMVDWGDYNNDGITDPFVTAMVRQNMSIRTQMLGFGDLSGFNMVNPFNAGVYGWGTIQYMKTGPGAGHVFELAHSNGTTRGAKIDAVTQTAPNEITIFGFNYPSFVYVNDGTIWATNVDNYIYRSSDGGVTFSQYVEIGSGDPNVNLMTATSIPAEIPIQASDNGQYISVLGTWGNATSAEEDIVYLYYSDDAGATWMGQIIARDEVYGQISNRPNYAPDFENFGQVSLNVDNAGVMHVTCNGYGVGIINSDTVYIIPALYWNSIMNSWVAMTDPAFEDIVDASGIYMFNGSSDRKYSGNALGNAYPVVSVSSDAQIVIYMWQAPEYDALGNFVIYPGDGGSETGEIIYSDIIARYSTNGGLDWSEILTVAGETQVMEQYPNLARRLELNTTLNTASAHMVFQVDATPGASIFNGQVWGQNSPNNNTEWRYYKYDFPVTLVQGIALTVPNGGENWSTGSSHNITWISPTVNNVKIEYTTDNGGSWLTIINSTPGSGYYQWTIPNTPSNNCRVKISDAANSSTFDISDNVFSISQHSVTVTSPNGGEIFVPGTVRNITWLGTNVTSVKIEYSTNTGIAWLNIVNSTPGDGIYEWTVPNTLSDECKVKISDAASPSVQDQSDGTFSISNFAFYALIEADTVWMDNDYNGLEPGTVDGSGSYISQGTITAYHWYVNNQLTAYGQTPAIELASGTNSIKLVVFSNTGLSTSDSMDISVYSAKIATGGSVLGGVTQFGNNFYVTSMNNGVYRIDSSGNISQSYITGGSIQSALCISKQTGLMYVGSSDTRLYSFDGTLNSIWDRGLGGVVNNAVSVNFSGEIVYAGANDNNNNLGLLKSLNGSNGNPRWTYQVNGNIWSSPVVLEVLDSNSIVTRTIIYFSTTKGNIYAVEDLGSTYTLLWSADTDSDSAIVSSPAISKNGMIYFGSKNGYLYRYNWDGYSQADWKRYTGGAIISSPVIDENGIVYTASSNGFVYGFPGDFTSNTDPLKIFYQDVQINGTAAIGPDGTLLLGCGNGKFYALDKDAAGLEMIVKWTFQSTGSIMAPTLVTEYGMVYIGSTTGDVYIMKDPGIGNREFMADYEWPTFKGDNQRSKVVRLTQLTYLSDENKIPVTFSLHQNYPNPFNPSTTISFSLPKAEYVSLKVYNALGEEIKNLVNNQLDAGEHKIIFDAAELSSGIYFYRINAGEYSAVKKLQVLK